MSIRSENNKIMLKIESMASRNERLVNISRKCNPFLFVIEKLLPEEEKITSIDIEQWKWWKGKLLVAFAHCTHQDSFVYQIVNMQMEIERQKRNNNNNKNSTKEKKCVFCARLQFTKIERRRKHILFFIYIKHFRCTRESNY